MLTKSHCFLRGRILLVAKEFSAWINLYSMRGDSIGLYCSFILYGHIHTYACQRMGLSAAVNNEHGSYSSWIRYFFCVNFLPGKTWAVLWTCNMDQDKGPCSSVSVLGSREVGEWWISEQNWILNSGLVIVPSNGENEVAGGVKLKTSMQRGCSVKVVG